MIGIIGKKIGMTQIYKEDGKLYPSTVIEAGPCHIVQVKSDGGVDGYNAVKLGFEESEKISKPQKGILSKSGVPNVKYLREFTVDSVDDYAVGSVLGPDIFEVGEKVVVTGSIKGRGFAGVTKRHGFKGGDSTHGCRAQRIPGSMGGSSDPSRIFKGKKLPGHYGTTRQSTKGLEVVMVDTERNLIFIKGAVPGSKKGLVLLTKQH
jgi:large subunit ribosomal protein L3